MVTYLRYAWTFCLWLPHHCSYVNLMPYFPLHESLLVISLDTVISSCCRSPLLQVLPANILLLSTVSACSFDQFEELWILANLYSFCCQVERSTNQGSLGGIDALLGCPLHLPSSKVKLQCANLNSVSSTCNLYWGLKVIIDGRIMYAYNFPHKSRAVRKLSLLLGILF